MVAIRNTYDDEDISRILRKMKTTIQKAHHVENGNPTNYKQLDIEQDKPSIILSSTMSHAAECVVDNYLSDIPDRKNSIQSDITFIHKDSFHEACCPPIQSYRYNIDHLRSLPRYSNMIRLPNGHYRRVIDPVDQFSDICNGKRDSTISDTSFDSKYSKSLDQDYPVAIDDEDDDRYCPLVTCCENHDNPTDSSEVDGCSLFCMQGSPCSPLDCGLICCGDESTSRVGRGKVSSSAKSTYKYSEESNKSTNKRSSASSNIKRSNGPEYQSEFKFQDKDRTHDQMKM